MPYATICWIRQQQQDLLEEWFDAIPLFSYKKCNSKKKRIVGNFIPHLML